MLHLGSRLCTLTLALLLAAPAYAGSITPSLAMSLEAGGMGYSVPTSSGTPNGDGTYSFSGSDTLTGVYQLLYTALVDPDPAVSGTFTLTNLAATTTEFILSVASTVGSVGAPTTLDGDYGTIDFFDDNNSNLVQYDPVTGSPFWSGQIDFVTVATLGNTGGSASGGPGVFGSTSGLTLATQGGGPAVNTNIGFELHFELSAGDRIVIPASFVVVPEPESGVLAAFALVALAALKRRSFAR